KLQVSQEIKDEVANAVNAGLTVQIPKNNVTQLGWTGVGYIISNPADGTGAYRISGGLNGGDSPAEGSTVIPLPQVPLTGPIGFVIGGLLANSDNIVIGNCGTSSPVFKGASMAAPLTQCIIAKPLIMSVGAETIGAAIVLAEILPVVITICLIFALVVAIAKTMPKIYLNLRYYTTYIYAPIIWSQKFIRESRDWIDTDFQFPGVYLTDLKKDPTILDNRIEIATILRIPPPPKSPDPERVTSYIDVKIDKMRVLLLTIPILYEHQYLYPTIIESGLMHDGDKIIFDDHGPFVKPIN
ncbi:hypothetical protein HXX01_05225, partial [Candidatus Nomurabacteria bacterium]|nr:hypothetical protein [Candidatus Nomurabacteria bacterium]